MRRKSLHQDDVGTLSRRGLLRIPQLVNDVRDGLVEGSVAPRDAGTCLRVTGAGTESVVVARTAHWPPAPSISRPKRRTVSSPSGRKVHTPAVSGPSRAGGPG